MKSFGSYISKHLASFAAFLLMLILINLLLFGLTFCHTVFSDYGDTSPRAMLEMTAAAASTESLTEEAAEKLRQHQIWALYLTPEGECFGGSMCPKKSPKAFPFKTSRHFQKAT